MDRATCLCGVLFAAAQAALAQTAGIPSHGVPIEIASCAGGPPLMLKSRDERALLDDTERDPLLAEMLTRFPVLARDRFAPPVLLLWHKERADWRYVSLQPNAFTGGGTLCFTATFVAQVFPQTPELMRKYFAVEMPAAAGQRAAESNVVPAERDD